MKMVDRSGEETAGNRLDRYLEQKSLQPFLYKGKKLDHYDPIICYDGEKKIHGYVADRFVDLCIGMSEAKDKMQIRMKIYQI